MQWAELAIFLGLSIVLGGLLGGYAYSSSDGMPAAIATD
jgi:hypothetical protein